MTEQDISYIEQSGVIPYRIQEGKIEILLITSLKKKRWIIPKGIIESDWLEANQRNRKWFSITEAIQQLRESELKRILINLPNTI